MKCSKCGKTVPVDKRGVSNGKTKKALHYKCLEEVLAPYLN